MPTEGEWMAKLRKMEQPLRSAVIERDALREALKFYADPENYFAIAVLADRPAGAFADDVGCVLMYDEHDHRHGRAARKALGDEWWGTEPCDEMRAFTEKEERRTCICAGWQDAPADDEYEYLLVDPCCPIHGIDGT